MKNYLNISLKLFCKPQTMFKIPLKISNKTLLNFSNKEIKIKIKIKFLEMYIHKCRLMEIRYPRLTRGMKEWKLKKRSNLMSMLRCQDTGHSSSSNNSKECPIIRNKLFPPIISLPNSLLRTNHLFNKIRTTSITLITNYILMMKNITLI